MSIYRFLYIERCVVHVSLTSDLFPTFYYPPAPPPSVPLLEVERGTEFREGQPWEKELNV